MSSLNRLPNGNIELVFSIPWEKVKKSYEKTLDKLRAETTVKGFRKGKAPKDLVEKQLSKENVFEEVLKVIVPDAYIAAIKEHNLKPIHNPNVEAVSLKESSDWQLKATTCEAPEFELGKYKEEIKKNLAPAKIWTPKDGDKPKQDNDDKTNLLFKSLLTSYKFVVPQILIEAEVTQMLSRLLDQTARLGITIEQYLASSGKTIEKLKEEYRHQAEETFRLEFVLAKIATEENIKASDEEIQKMIAAIPDENTRKAMSTPAQINYVKSIIAKRKVIDSLLALV